jgi:hypothetical protein
MKGAKPGISPEQYARLREVKLARRSIPSNKELAREIGPHMSEKAVERIIRHGIRRYEMAYSHENGDGV